MDRAPSLPTIGVEEEFLLLDPATGRPVPAAPEVLRRTGRLRGVQPELMQYQVEAVTGVCEGLDQVRDQLWALRRSLSEAAAEQGCRLVASGISPYANPGLAFVTEEPRYRELARHFPACAAVFGTCACHVHVAAPSRDAGVRALTGLRPWLAPLLALSANSPVSAGRLSGWQSRRYTMVSRWLTAQPPGRWRDGRHYERTIRTLLSRGSALDERGVYFFARLSSRYPTVEVRVTDVCPDVDTAVLITALVRGLVVTALRRPAGPDARSLFVQDGLVAAAHNGLPGMGIDPVTGRAVPQRRLVDRLLEHVEPALAEAGDREAVDRCLALLARRGTGADRQSRQFRLGWSPAAFTRELARTTLTAPARGVPVTARG